MQSVRRAIPLSQWPTLNLIGPVPRTTAAKITAFRGQRRALPADLLRDASWAPRWRSATVCDGRADLYALGCVAFYLLTGQQVFEGDTAMQVIAQHLQAVPVPLSQRVAFAVPPRLEQLVLACLAKKPEDRPQSATALSSQLASIDLEPWTDGQAQAWWAAAGTRLEQAAGAAGESVTREVSIHNTGP